ncbi:MAG: peptide ABC transporter substrate-binding protein [Deltaproteobacteria bacterium]|nr:peptide ABC transporter substrate-binding protein [Deltaproteobacteria bacterium]
MTIKRILIFLPTFLIIFLVQSYFWVPTYKQQTRGNPERLKEYITGSIGDASILNPILSADSASSQIESMVFEGLIDRDKNLHFRGRLASSWEIHEEAYFYINEHAYVPGLGIATAEEIAGLIKNAKEKKDSLDSGLKASLKNISRISIITPKTFITTRNKHIQNRTKKDRKLRITVRAPAMIKLELNKVDQDLFLHLEKLLGNNYYKSFNGEQYLNTATEAKGEIPAEYTSDILPPFRHNPVLIFHLRPNIRFHDGHIFDAGDVKFTYESIMDPKNLSPRIADFEPVKSVEVVDPLTVRIVYKRLYSPALGTWGIGILPEHLLNREALKKEAVRLGKDPETFSMRQSGFNRKPTGCGPFKFKEWRSDQFIALARFDDYWEGPANYKDYIVRIIPDPLTQEMEFYAGTIDSYGVQPHQVKRLKADSRFQHFSGTSLGYTYIAYNMRRKPFDNPMVRKALSMAIDVNDIIDHVLYGQGERITGPFVKQTDYYNKGIKPVPYDPEGALKLLKKAGWTRNRNGWLEKNGKPLRFTLITNNGNELRKAVLAIAQDAWRRIGIDVSTDLLEWSVFIQERVNKADFDSLILGWSMGIEPDLYQIWHSSQTGPCQLNFAGFRNKEADALIIKIRQEYDHEKQVEYAHKLHEIIAREQPCTFLYVGRWTAILDRRIVIKEIDDKGNVHYKKIEPTKTGDYTFSFNKWIKLDEMPRLMDEN